MVALLTLATFSNRMQVGLFLFCIAWPKVTNLSNYTVGVSGTFAGLIMRRNLAVQTRGRGKSFFCETAQNSNGGFTCSGYL